MVAYFQLSLQRPFFKRLVWSPSVQTFFLAFERVLGAKSLFMDCERSVTHVSLYLLLLLGLALCICCYFVPFFISLIPATLALAAALLGIPHIATDEAIVKCNFIFAPLPAIRHLNHLLLLLFLAGSVSTGAHCYFAFEKSDGEKFGMGRRGWIIAGAVLSAVVGIVASFARVKLNQFAPRAFMKAAYQKIRLLNRQQQVDKPVPSNALVDVFGSKGSEQQEEQQDDDVEGQDTYSHRSRTSTSSTVVAARERGREFSDSESSAEELMLLSPSQQQLPAPA